MDLPVLPSLGNPLWIPARLESGGRAGPSLLCCPLVRKGPPAPLDPQEQWVVEDMHFPKHARKAVWPEEGLRG